MSDFLSEMSVNDSGLTDAGRAAFAESLNRFALDLMREANRQAVAKAEHPGPAEVTAADVLSALQELRSSGSRRTKRSRERTLVGELGTFYVLSGALVSSVAIVFLLLNHEIGSPSGALIAGFAGTITALTGSAFSLLTLLRSRKEEAVSELVPNSPFDSTVEFLTEWQAFERVLRSIKWTSGVDLRKRTLGQFITDARESHYLTADEYGEVRAILALRNDVVHSSVRQDPVKLRLATEDLVRLRRSLSARAAERTLRGEGA